MVLPNRERVDGIVGTGGHFCRGVFPTGLRGDLGLQGCDVLQQVFGAGAGCRRGDRGGLGRGDLADFLIPESVILGPHAGASILAGLRDQGRVEIDGLVFVGFQQFGGGDVHLCGQPAGVFHQLDVDGDGLLDFLHGIPEKFEVGHDDFHAPVELLLSGGVGLAGVLGIGLKAAADIDLFSLVQEEGRVHGALPPEVQGDLVAEFPTVFGGAAVADGRCQGVMPAFVGSGDKGDFTGDAQIGTDIKLLTHNKSSFHVLICVAWR